MPRFPYAAIARLLPDEDSRRRFVSRARWEGIGCPERLAWWALRGRIVPFRSVLSQVGSRL